MITEKQEEQLIRRITDQINKANEYFLKSIGSYIKQIKSLSPSKAHQLVQILKYGGDYKKIVKKLEKYVGISAKDLGKIFKEYAKKDAMFYEQFYNYRNKPFKDNLLDDEIKAIVRVNEKALYDYTKPDLLGFTIRDTKNNVMKFLNLRETYNYVLDQAVLNVSQGKETFNQGMKRIIEEIGSSGLRKVEYESGRSYRLDSVVRMHLKDSLRDLHNRNVELYGEDFGADGYEISVHRYPADDHSIVQGKQFYIKDYEKLQKDGIAPDVNKKEIDITTKYGFRPISTMNCYHYIFPIIVGVNKPLYSDQELEDIRKENEEGFEYEGRHYSMYEGTQLQRNIERNIREQKDIQILARASGDEETAMASQKRINLLSRKYKELSDVSTLPTDKKRMTVSGYRKIKVQEDNIKSVSKTNTKGKTTYEILEEQSNSKALTKDYSNTDDRIRNMASEYYEELGYDGKPKIIDESEYTQFKSEGYKEIARGIRGYGVEGKNGEDFMRQYEDEDMYIGNQRVFGSGTYYSYEKDAENTISRYSNVDGITYTALMDKDTRIISNERLNELKTEYTSKVLEKANKLMAKNPDEARKYYERMNNIINLDNGIFASAMGYDAIDVKDAEYIVSLNRKKIILKKRKKI